jgi:hypothetical protein
MRPTRRFAQVALGLLWLLDAGLQLQPFMFTRDFATDVLAVNEVGQPWFVADPVSWAASLTAAHPVPAGLAFALAQLVIAVAILVPGTSRLGLALSIPWSAGVWLIGEGLGGIFAGHVDIFTGAPGAVVLYAILAVAAWPRHGPHGLRSDAPLPYWLVPAWAVLWLGFAALTLMPGTDAVHTISGEIDMMAQMTPGWLAGLDARLSTWVSSAGMAGVLAFALLCAAIGLMAFARGTVRIVSVCAGLAVAAFAGLVGQAFGALFSGSATDPGTGPLIVLFGLCLLGVTGANEPSPEPLESAQAATEVPASAGTTDRAPDMSAVS